MFTGLIETTGRIAEARYESGGLRLRVASSLAVELRLGDSIAVSGVCLTVAALDGESFTADVSPETLRATSLGAAAVGQTVNLERPLRADDRLGGHFVLGHVDAVGVVRDWRPDGSHYWLEVELPDTLLPLVIPKGSIAVDGISLTIAALTGRRIGMQIVPFTRAHTALEQLHIGDIVNLEADVIGKYVARLLVHPQHTPLNS